MVYYPAEDGSLPRNWDLSPLSTARSIIEEFKHQMEQGLSAGRSGSLAMIETFIPRTARFHPGTYVGLDMSGTNFRVAVLSVNPDQSLSGSPRIRIFPIPSRLKRGEAGREAHSRDLFRFLAGGIALTLEEERVAASGLRVGFTFAFPTRMESADRGVLLKWTKEWDLPDLVGRDPVPELARAFREAGLQGVKVNVLLNDTVGTLILGYFRDRRTLAGGILGTGTNLAAWLGSTAINFECGNFDLGPLRDRVLTPVDRDLDSRSRNPGQQRFEKMVAGRYLGGLLRRLLAEFHPQGRFGERGAVGAEDVSHLAADSGGLPETRRFLERSGVVDDGLKQRRQAASLARMILRRSAQLSALAMIATAEWADPKLEDDHVMTVDGSLFEHAPGYPEAMRRMFRNVLGSRAERLECRLVKDGSGIGAALASSAVEARWRS
ncbi:MAG: hypothetical protein OXH11_05755 [Candidatus Aminicenantes bacterium]|nr:hypothetical protein [Candidatus Aminicenantes bacterium]